MIKFLNRSASPQTVYLPSTVAVANDTRHVIDVGHSIQVKDQRDIDLLRQLNAFVEVPDDQPTTDYRRSRMSL
jgi:hypothetical protein